MKSRANVQALLQCAVLSLVAAALAACSDGPAAVPTTLGALPGAPVTGQASAARTALTSAGYASTPNWGGAWMFTDDDSDAYTILAQYATPNTNITWPIYHRDPAIESKVAPSQTIFYASSLAQVSSGAQTSVKPPWEFYDIEHWSATPLTEQQDPVGSIAKAAQIAHAAGKKFGVSPDGIYMGVTRCTFEMSLSIIPQVDWTRIDELNIQGQHLASDNTCSKVGSASFQYMVDQVASYVMSKNPNIRISAQLSMRDSSPARLIAAANAVYGTANVIHISDPDTSYSCVYCTLSDLSAVLAAL